MYFKYLCESCFKEQYFTGKPDNRRCSCGGLLRRVYDFQFVRSMPDHFNQSTGQYVTNERHFKDQLKQRSEEASLRTGMDHNFQPVDITDMKALGVTDEGLEETHKTWHDHGLPPPI